MVPDARLSPGKSGFPAKLSGPVGEFLIFNFCAKQAIHQIAANRGQPVEVGADFFKFVLQANDVRAALCSFLASFTSLNRKPLELI